MPHGAALPAPTALRKPGTATRSPGLRRWRIRTRAQPCPTAPRRLPDGLPGVRHSSTVSTRSDPSSIPEREAEPSRATPYRTQRCGIPGAAPPSCSWGGTRRYAPPSRPKPRPAPRPTRSEGWICPRTTPTQPPTIMHFQVKLSTRQGKPT